MKVNYKSLIKWAKMLLASLMISAAIVPHVSAHLMVAQNGTLNFKGNSVYMVLSLPVSAFENIDDDGDGKMSAAEFNKYKPTIMSAVKNNIRLSDKESPRPLQGLLLTPVASHTAEKAPTDQIIVMGRFALSTSTSSLSTTNEKVDAANSNDLVFYIGLFGKKKDEKSLSLTATRKLTKGSKAQKIKVELTPEKPEENLFAKS